MADLCENELTVWGEKKALEQFRKTADERRRPLSERDPFRGANEPSVLSFHRLMPFPPEVVARGYDAPGGGYDWEREHWGVKWGACQAQKKKFTTDTGETGLYYTFDTAWLPPIDFFQTVSKQSPELTFCLEFCTQTRWCGTEYYQAGEETDEY